MQLMELRHQGVRPWIHALPPPAAGAPLAFAAFAGEGRVGPLWRERAPRHCRSLRNPDPTQLQADPQGSTGAPRKAASLFSDIAFAIRRQK